MARGTARTRAAWLATGLTILAAVAWLHRQGRVWWCVCGRATPWVGSAWSAETSQHLLDPYSFTHLLHGVVFCGALALVLPRVARAERLCLAVVLELCWELFENSELVIRRYRETTAALGYHGDSIGNSLGDVLCCALGFRLAAYLGPRRSLALYVLVELCLLATIRDCLTLNVLMLVHPIEALRVWQAGG